MNIINNTDVTLPEKWIQRIMDRLGVNPTIHIVYRDNPEENEKANCYNRILGKNVECDAVAVSDNTVWIYFGGWENGVFRRWTKKYLRWIICHELCHHKYNYLHGHINDPFRGLTETERYKRGELACDRFANSMVGVRNRDFCRYESKKR